MSFKFLGKKPPKSANAIDYESKKRSEHFRGALLDAADFLKKRERNRIQNPVIAYREELRLIKWLRVSAGEE